MIKIGSYTTASVVQCVGLVFLFFLSDVPLSIALWFLMILLLQKYGTLSKGQLHDSEGNFCSNCKVARQMLERHQFSTYVSWLIQKAAKVDKESVWPQAFQSVVLSRHSQVSGSEHLPPNLQREHMEQVSEVLHKVLSFLSSCCVSRNSAHASSLTVFLNTVQTCSNPGFKTIPLLPETDSRASHLCKVTQNP